MNELLIAIAVAVNTSISFYVLIEGFDMKPSRAAFVAPFGMFLFIPYIGMNICIDILNKFFHQNKKYL